MWTALMILAYAVSCISGNPTEEIGLSRKKRGSFTQGEGIRTILGLGNSLLDSTGSACSTCTTVVSFLQFIAISGSSDEELTELAMMLNENMHFMQADIAYGMITNQVIPFVHILRTCTLSGGEICNLVLQTECVEPDGNRKWEVQLPEPKQPIEDDIQLSPECAKKSKVLLLSDLHWDPLYVVGTWAECGMQVCCRAEVGEPAPNASLSGKYGGWECDTPWSTIEHLFEHLAEEHSDVDYIVWAGDLNPHDMWSFNKTDKITLQKKLVALFAKYFPKTPCFPALGNHDTHPTNFYPTIKLDEDDKYSVDWVYDEFAKQWGKWLPAGCAEPIRRGGFYTVLVRPGFRIISLNTNFCYIYDWWLLINDNDPLGELQWLIEVLQAAEDNNEKVHIIGHVPPGWYECLKIWQTNYLKILCRYSHIITAQFFGHTHKDEFHLHFDPQDLKRICGVSFVIPGVSTFTYLNPGYQIAYVDEKTGYVLDKTTYVFDLEKANECEDYAVWTKLYSAKEAYNMSSLLPSEWKVILDRIVTDDDFFCLYHKHFWKDSPTRPPCDEEWRKTYISYIYSYAQYGEYKNQCD